MESFSNGLNTFYEHTKQKGIYESRNLPKLKRQKLRRLYNEKTRRTYGCIERAAKVFLKWFVWSSIIIAVVLATLLNNESVNFSRGLSDFFIKYTSQYKQILHNKIDYCGRQMNVPLIMSNIRPQILNQERALLKLEQALNNQTEINSIALIGTSGVGKSLTAHILREHFPWPENTHSYSWNTYVQDEVHKYHTVRALIEELSRCGRNLLIIDNLTPCDYELVPILNRLVRDREGDTNAATATANAAVAAVNGAEKYVILLYIFNLNTLLPEDQLMQQYDVLQQLPDTAVINYERFGRDELRDCIMNELKLENMKIKDKYFNELMESIDVDYSGCKTVHPKVLIYGDQIYKNY